MKNIFYLFVVLAAVAICAVSGDSQHKRSSGNCKNSVTWELDESTMTMTVSGTGRMQDCKPEKAKEIKTVIISEGITEISIGAFQDWYSLSSVTLPETMTKVENIVFKNTLLESIHIPKLLTRMDGGPFWNCSKLTKFTVDGDNTAFTAENDILFSKDKTTIVKYPSGKSGVKYDIPAGVKIVGPYCFQACSNLKSITIPDSVYKIDTFGFSHSGSISIVIPSTVTNFQEYGFSNQAELSYVKYLGNKNPCDDTKPMFKNCPKLTSVCVNSNYESEKFCNITVDKNCPEPPPVPSDPESGSFLGVSSAVLALMVLIFAVVF